jgi:hypothetical protein
MGDFWGWVWFLIPLAVCVLALREYRVAKMCFAISGLLLAWKVAMELHHDTHSLSVKLLVAFLLCGLVGAVVVGSWAWIDRKRSEDHGPLPRPNVPAAWQGENASVPSPSKAGQMPKNLAGGLPTEQLRHPAPKAVQGGSGAHATPGISAYFVRGTSPGVVLLNPSPVVVRDPSCSIVMWDLTKNPPVSLPTFNQYNPGQYIKPGEGLLLATLDNPSMKPQIDVGDKVFGFVSIDCPDCRTARFYWLYVAYGKPDEAWYSEVPGGYPVSIISVSRGLENAGWDVDRFISQVPHAERMVPENAR